MKQNDLKFSLAMVSIASSEPFASMVIEERSIALSAFDNTALPTKIPQGITIRELLERWDQMLPTLHAARAAYESGPDSAALREQSLPLDALYFHTPVDHPRQLFCTGANYRQHVIGLMLGDPDMRGVGREKIDDPAELRRLAEATMDERAAGGTPYMFIRLPATLTGARSEVFIPRYITKPDWELELAVVIGRTACNVSAEDAMSYVAGFAIINDLTARELVFRKDMPAMGADWLRGKNWPNSAPFGPLLVPACFVDDPYALKIQLWLNDQLMQNESTSDMVINIARQIEYLSSIATLFPGDIIATGSPAGNGSHYGVFLKPGDVIKGEITGLGQQEIRCT